MNLNFDTKQMEKEVKKQADNIMLKKIIDELYKALNAPGRWRRKIIKWIFPEIIDVADELRKYYWK